MIQKIILINLCEKILFYPGDRRPGKMNGLAKVNLLIRNISWLVNRNLNTKLILNFFALFTDWILYTKINFFKIIKIAVYFADLPFKVALLCKKVNGGDTWFNQFNLCGKVALNGKLMRNI